VRPLLSDTRNPSKCEKEGFAAGLSGDDRATNPYALILSPDARPWLKKLQRDMSTAWWCGWDKAHHQLAGKGSFVGHAPAAVGG
jgi:hypothetical protein